MIFGFRLAGSIFVRMKLAILSRNPKLYSTRRLAEAAAARGHQVNIIDHSQCHILLDRGKPLIYYKNKLLEGLDAIIPRIGASVTQHGTMLIRQFELQGVFTPTSSLALARSRDKLVSLQIINGAGLGVPKTAFTRYSTDIDSFIRQVGGPPVIIKLLEGTQGLGVIKAETIQAAKSFIETLYNLNASILVQEYIAEADGTDIRVFIVGGKIIAAMKRQGAKGEFRSNLHRGGEATLTKLTDSERITAIRAAKALGLGIAGVDLLRSKRGPLVIEVNSSPGLEGIETASKKDIASTIIQYVEQQLIKSRPKVLA